VNPLEKRNNGAPSAQDGAASSLYWIVIVHRLERFERKPAGVWDRWMKRTSFALAHPHSSAFRLASFARFGFECPSIGPLWGLLPRLSNTNPRDGLPIQVPFCGLVYPRHAGSDTRARGAVELTTVRCRSGCARWAAINRRAGQTCGETGLHDGG
jgi:hypothetical protein